MGKIKLTEQDYHKAIKYLEKIRTEAHEATVTQMEALKRELYKRKVAPSANAVEKIKDVIINPIFDTAEIKYDLFIGFLEESRDTEQSIEMTEKCMSIVAEYAKHCQDADKSMAAALKEWE